MRKLWLLLLFPVAALGQHYPILPVPGSPPEITVLLQSSDSAMWVAARDDVYKFDGSHFYGLRPYGFPAEKPTALAEDSDHGIWIATRVSYAPDANNKGGLYRYRSGSVEKIFSGDVRSVVSAGPETMLASVAKSQTSNYWDLYIFRRTQGGWQATRLFENTALYMTADPRGNILYPCPGGVCELSKRQLLDWPRSSLHPEGDRRLHPGGTMRVLRDRFDCLWYRTEVTVNSRCPEGVVTPVPDSIATADSSVSLGESSDGSILLAGGVLAMGRPGAWRIAGTLNGLPGGYSAPLAARDGTIFLGASDGLYRFMHPFQLEYWNQNDGVDSPYFVGRIHDRMLASNAGIAVLDRSRARWIPWASNKDVGTAVHLLNGPGDTVYAASLIRGITQLSGGGRVLAHSLWGPGGARLAADFKGRTWLAVEGISLVTAGEKRLIATPVKEVSADGTTLDMEYDAKRDALWACHGREIVLLERSQWTHITRKDGIFDDPCRSIAVMPDGDVWVGYSTVGVLSRIRRSTSGEFTVETFGSSTAPGVPNTAFLDSDRRDWLWWALGSDKAEDGGDFLATPEAAAKGDWLRLGKDDGIPDPGGNQNSFSNDTDGSIWFASNNTIVHFHPPADFATNFPAPGVFVSGFTLPGSVPVMAENLRGVPHGADLVAHIGSLQFDRRNALRFRYRLLPGQPEWKETNGFDLPLGKLGWGAHTLEVQGRMLTGEWSGVQRATFNVMLPVWLTWPYLLGMGASGVAVGFGVLQWRRHQRLIREAVLPDLSAWRLGALAPESEQLLGTVVDGRYEIGHILSVGGFATVVRARDLRDGGKLCAVKIFRYELGDQAWVRHRFEQEVTALEQLVHPNIVRITGHGNVQGGAPYLVMEFIQGRSLREVLEERATGRAAGVGDARAGRRNGALPRRQAAVFLRQLASALKALHERSIYHRDLKPENLMIRADADNGEQLVLIDFSIAIVRSPDETFHGISRVAGTLGYMAPEQVIGYADATTDIYALAKVVMEMLTGSRWMDLLPEGTLDMPSFLRGYLATNPCGLGAESVEMLAAALAFDPARRPKDISAFAEPILQDLERPGELP
jgi:tRNA A-37 threonylcarbamoyl transferase component Bud32